MHTQTLPPSPLAPWRWRDVLWGLLLGLGLCLLLLLLRPQVLQAWQALLAWWFDALGISGTARDTPPPSAGMLQVTGTAVLGLYALAGLWHERYRPLRVVVRALCLVQASACVFFALAPAQFPWAVDQHLASMLQMNADFLSLVPLMLALGWGVLNLPWRLKLLGPLAVAAYFGVWLPHQVVLHAWVLHHASVLFMPLLLLCLGPLLNGWIFVSLYAWLASLTPRTGAAGAGA